MPAALEPGQVHLWRAVLDLPPAVAAELAGSLSAEEHERAGQLRGATVASRYRCARGWLRHLLGRYLDSDAGSIVLRGGTNGKPRLHPESWLRFNVSHSDGLVVVAVARDREVGVDIERIRADIDVGAVARRFLTVRQRGELASLADGARTQAFFALWTRNEAYLKGLGVGLDGGDHEVDAAPGWSVAAFDGGRGYASAVAVEGVEVVIPPVATPLSL